MAYRTRANRAPRSLRFASVAAAAAVAAAAVSFHSLHAPLPTLCLLSTFSFQRRNVAHPHLTQSLALAPHPRFLPRALRSVGAMYNTHRGMIPHQQLPSSRLTELLEQIRQEFDAQAGTSGEFDRQREQASKSRHLCSVVDSALTTLFLPAISHHTDPGDGARPPEGLPARAAARRPQARVSLADPAHHLGKAAPSDARHATNQQLRETPRRPAARARHARRPRPRHRRPPLAQRPPAASAAHDRARPQQPLWPDHGRRRTRLLGSRPAAPGAAAAPGPARAPDPGRRPQHRATGSAASTLWRLPAWAQPERCVLTAAGLPASPLFPLSRP